MTTTKQLTKTSDPPSAEIIEKVIMSGDLSGLTPHQRLAYYKNVCETLHLNPLTKPFDYIVLDGKLTLYATKDCAAQLRKRQRITIAITSREKEESVYIVTAKASLRTISSVEPREDESIGVVSIINKDGAHIKGTALANAIMKAETKAKRRVTLSICGLGMLDEDEIEDVTNSFDQRSEAEIAERNVRQATANATEATNARETAANHAITENNWRDVEVHVGKAQGNMLGKKVGDLPRNIVMWMHENWRNKLGPSATDQDMRLKKAIEAAYEEFKKADSAAQDRSERVEPPAVAQDSGAAKQACITDLRGRIEDLVLTEKQAVGYLIVNGLVNQDATTFNEVQERILLHLCTPQGWDVFKATVEADVKPKPAPEPPKPKARRRK